MHARPHARTLSPCVGPAIEPTRLPPRRMTRRPSSAAHTLTAPAHVHKTKCTQHKHHASDLISTPTPHHDTPSHQSPMSTGPGTPHSRRRRELHHSFPAQTVCRTRRTWSRPPDLRPDNPIRRTQQFPHRLPNRPTKPLLLHTPLHRPRLPLLNHTQASAPVPQAATRIRPAVVQAAEAPTTVPQTCCANGNSSCGSSSHNCSCCRCSSHRTARCISTASGYSTSAHTPLRGTIPADSSTRQCAHAFAVHIKTITPAPHQVNTP